MFLPPVKGVDPLQLLISYHIAGAGMVKKHHVDIANVQLFQCLIDRGFRV